MSYLHGAVSFLIKQKGVVPRYFCTLYIQKGLKNGGQVYSYYIKSPSGIVVSPELFESFDEAEKAGLKKFDVVFKERVEELKRIKGIS